MRKATMNTLCPLSWHALVRDMGLTGMTRILASKCVFEYSSESDGIGLALSTEYLHLVSDRFIERLYDALESEFGMPFDLQIRPFERPPVAHMPLPETWKAEDLEAIDEIRSNESLFLH